VVVEFPQFLIYWSNEALSVEWWPHGRVGAIGFPLLLIWYKSYGIHQYLRKAFSVCPSVLRPSTVRIFTMRLRPLLHTVQCSAVCAVQCSAVQYVYAVDAPSPCPPGQCGSPGGSAVQCSAVQCSAVQCSAVQCSAVQCSAVQCSVAAPAASRLHLGGMQGGTRAVVEGPTVQCSAVQCSAVQCSTVQCSAVGLTGAVHSVDPVPRQATDRVEQDLRTVVPDLVIPVLQMSRARDSYIVKRN
jgi:hypothetical protein